MTKPHIELANQLSQTVDAMATSQLLRKWYHLNKRDLPWRNTDDPYHIWISEIILQQTQVVQGINYYHRFINRFPTVQDLADASQDEVLKYWEGLGYYSRARNLHKAAHVICTEHNQHLPTTYEQLLALPGIGPYTAGAIASFAFNQATPAVDGNVLRVLSRLYACDEPIDTTLGNKLYRELAQRLIPQHDPADHNQAMIELGALICQPSNPQCDLCPISTHCLVANLPEAQQLPRKVGKVKVRQEHQHWLLCHQPTADGQQIWLRKRPQKGVWAGLYEPIQLTAEQAAQHRAIAQIEHRLTHRALTLHFYVSRDTPTDIDSDYQVYPFTNTDELPALPIPIKKVIDDYFAKTHIL